MRARPAPPALLVHLLVLGGCALSRPPPPPVEPRFDAGLAAAEVGWLADPARTGRGTGTAGGAEAAAWLAERMREIGLQPAGTEGYAQPFDAPFRATLGAGNALALGATSPRLSEGWQPFTFSDDGTAEAELVFAGYGISAPELGYDDYAGIDVKGKVVLVVQDFPREDDATSLFRDPKHYRFGEWRQKATTARDKGAVAIVGVRDDWHHPGADDLSAWKGSVASRAGLLAVRVTAAALGAAGVDVAALAKPIGEAMKPASRALGVAVKVTVAVQVEKARTANLVGLLPGRDPALAGQCVVVGAHHDHLGWGGESSAAPDQVGRIHPGADDNASGIAGLLAVARAFAAGAPPRRTVVFVAFGAEELGLLGSSQAVKAPPAACPLDGVQLMVNLDMIGRPQRAKDAAAGAPGRLYVHGVDTAKGLREQVRALADRPPRIGLAAELGGDGYGASDHTSYYARNVPVLFLFNGAHADYHRPTDTAEKIDAAGLAEAARLAWRAAAWAANEPARLEVVRLAPPRPGGAGGGNRPSLGTIPDFAERQEPGVLLTGVMPGSPAEKAGLAGGDVLVRLGEKKILNLQDLQYALSARRPGDKVEVEYLRDGRSVVVTVVLAERR
jgi:aminopeptidase YwaD